MGAGAAIALFGSVVTYVMAVVGAVMIGAFGSVPGKTQLPPL